MKRESHTINRCLEIATCLVAIAFSLMASPAAAQETSPSTSVLITNVRILDGESGRLREGMSVLTENNKIAKSITAPGHATVIDGGGRTLMPGMI